MTMDLFDAKSDRGLERRMDETDLRNLYGAGYLHLDSPVRRLGSPNWFAVEEMFPHFERILTTKKYSANFKPTKAAKRFRKTLILLFAMGLIVFWLTRFSQKAARLQGFTPAASGQTAR